MILTVERDTAARIASRRAKLKLRECRLSQLQCLDWRTQLREEHRAKLFAEFFKLAKSNG